MQMLDASLGKRVADFCHVGRILIKINYALARRKPFAFAKACPFVARNEHTMFLSDCNQAKAFFLVRCISRALLVISMSLSG